MLLSDLEDLEDITNLLDFEDQPSIFTEEYAVELVETALHLMDEYISCNPQVVSEPDFQDILLEEITDIFYIQIEDYMESEHLINSDDIEDDMNELLEDAFQIFITVFYPDRCSNDGIENSKYQSIEIKYDDAELAIIENKIQSLRDIPQPIQRTDAWYQFRWNLITASNAWKAFESQPAINQLI